MPMGGRMAHGSRSWRRSPAQSYLGNAGSSRLAQRMGAGQRGDLSRRRSNVATRLIMDIKTTVSDEAAPSLVWEAIFKDTRPCQILSLTSGW